MPQAPYAKLLVSVDGGGVTSGAVNATIGQTLDFSIENPTGVTGGYRWVLYDFPPDMTAPSGWSTDENDGTYYSVATTPPTVTVTHWGKILPALFINGATMTSADPNLRDLSTGISVLSTNLGMPGISALELQQFYSRGYPVDFMKSLELIDSNVAGYADVSTLRARAPENGVAVKTDGYASRGDGGGGTWVGVTGATPGEYTHNGGTVIVPSGGDGSAAWVRVYSGRIDVRWFGASTDRSASQNATAIQAALDAADDVLIPEGTFLTQPLAFNSNQTIRGVGRNSVLMLARDGYSDWANNQQLLYPKSWKTGATDNVEIADLTLDGDKDNFDSAGVGGDGAANGVGTWGVRGLVIENVLIRECWTDGIYVHGNHSDAGGSAVQTTDIVVRNFRIEHCGRNGISVVSGEHGRIVDGVIDTIDRTVPRAAIDLEPNSGQSFTVEDWEIHEVEGLNVNIGIAVIGSTGITNDDVTIRDCKMSASTHAYLMDGSTNTELYDCHGKDCASPGFYWTGGQGLQQGCTFENGTNFAIQAEYRNNGGNESDAKVIIDGFTVRNHNYGIANLRDTDVEAEINDLTIKDVTSTVPLITVTCPNVSIDGLKVYGSSYVGHTFEATVDVKVNNCIIDTVGTSGLHKVSSAGKLVGHNNSWQNEILDVTATGTLYDGQLVHLNPGSAINYNIDIHAQWQNNRLVFYNHSAHVVTLVAAGGATLSGTTTIAAGAYSEWWSPDGTDLRRVA